jgi:hypothetical protein
MINVVYCFLLISSLTSSDFNIIYLSPGGHFTGTLTTASVVSQTFTAEFISTWTGLHQLVVIYDAASINQCAQSTMCTDYQFYGDPKDRLDGDLQRKCIFMHIYYNSKTFAIPDPTHSMENQRNNVKYSEKYGTKFLLLKDAEWRDGKYVDNYFNIDDEIYNDDDDGRINLADLIYRRYGYVLVDWFICFEEPFTEYQKQIGRISVSRGITQEVFNAPNTAKMNAGQAIKFFSHKLKVIEEEICQNIRSSSAGVLSVKENVILRGLTVFGPYKALVNEWWDVANGKDIEGSKKCIGKGIVRERLTHKNKDKLLIMRNVSRMVNKVERDIRDLINAERLFNENKASRKKGTDDNPLTDPKINVQIPNKKAKKDKIKVLPSTFSVFRNSITYQTHNMVYDIGMGMAGLVEWYSLIHRPDISIDAKNISNDPAEEHFGSMKFYCKGDLGQDRVIDTEARGAQFRILEGNAFVARGFLHKRKNKRNKYLSSRIYINGNCEANNDNGENEIETKYINRTHSVKRNDIRVQMHVTMLHFFFL